MTDTSINSPYIKWLVPGKILVVTPDKELSLEESDQFFQTLNQELDKSSDKIHVVADLTNLRELEKGTLHMLNLPSYQKFVTHPHLGKQGAVNASNEMVKLIVKISKVFGASAKYYNSLEEAKADMFKNSPVA